jgi:hypothetical protein
VTRGCICVCVVLFCLSKFHIAIFLIFFIGIGIENSWACPFRAVMGRRVTVIASTPLANEWCHGRNGERDPASISVFDREPYVDCGGRLERYVTHMKEG